MSRYSFNFDIDISTFRGGIHPENDGKALSCNASIRTAPVFEYYHIPLQQNIGASPKWVVQIGDTVKKGQKIAEADGFVSCPLHAPTSGTVEKIEKRPGTMGIPVETMILKSDMLDEAYDFLPGLNWRECPPAELKQRIAECGIVGMGGAAFPTAVKLSVPPDKKITDLIVNGAECEPYLTADHRLMLECPEKVLIGASIMGRILGIDNIHIGVEMNKADAIETLIEHNKPYNVNIHGLQVQYPQGAEKQLIYAVTRRKVPAGGLPMDAGAVVQNVATAVAIAEAVIEGKPLFERITTITGEAVKTPGNWRLRIGTPLSKALELADGITEEPGKIILGGPMMGFAQKSLEASIQKNSGGLLLLPPSKVVQYCSSPCIRCGRCLNACPMNINPSYLGTVIENEKFDLALDSNVMDCIECGACAYICPAHRPLVQHIRRAKAEIRSRMAAQKQTDNKK